jgi:lysophospholipase L1-like esterase
MIRATRRQGKQVGQPQPPENLTTETPARVAGQWGRAGRLIAGVAFSIGVFLALGEIITRQFSVIDRLNGIPRRLYLATSTPDLPYRLRPGVDIQARKFHIRVNSLGLRGAEIPAGPEPGRKRILVLGDSVVYGEGLEEPDTFPVLLERELNQHGGGRAAYRVLNGAAPGYDTEAELAYLRDIGLSLSADALILGVSLNDFGPAPGLTPFGFLTVNTAERTGIPWLTNHSEFYMLLRWSITYARGNHWFQRVAREIKSPPAPFEERWPKFDQSIARMHKRFYAAPAGPKWERVRRSLVGLRDRARASGLPLTLVIFPEKDQIELPEPNLDPQRQWMGLCEEFQLDCFDLVPAFAASAGDALLFQDTQHPNAAGMRIAARAVAAYLAP